MLDYGFELGLILLKWENSFLDNLDLIEDTRIKTEILSLLKLVSSQECLLEFDYPTTPTLTIYGKAARLWKEGEILKAATVLKEHLKLHPNDLLSLQICRTGYYYLGMSKQSLELLLYVLPFHENSSSKGYLQGIMGFIYNQLKDNYNSLLYCNHALSIHPTDHWARHALVHYFHTREEFVLGIEMLINSAEIWDVEENTLRTHLFWHLALFYIKIGNLKQAIIILRTKITLTNMMDLLDYSSLSFRLQIKASQQLVNAWNLLGQSHSLIFNDAHALLILPIAAIESWVDKSSLKGDYKRIYESVGMKLFSGIISFRKGDYMECISLFDGLDLRQIGGSNSQREIFTHLVEMAHSLKVSLNENDK